MDSYREHHYQSDAGAWTLARMPASPALRPWVHEYVGYRESGTVQALVRREVPSTVVALIINFGSPFSIADPRPNAPWLPRDTFIAGLHERPAFVASDGNAYCLQIDFTPLGACRFFNSTLGAINHVTTPLEDVFGHEADLWREQLRLASHWRQRFAIVNQWLMRRFDEALQPRPEVERAWQLLRQTRGQIKISTLAQQLNCSREHCSRIIKNELGMAPKNLAKVIRFETALELIGSSNFPLADIASRCGYNDQAHFSRECKRLTGYTPRQLLNQYQPEQGLLEPH